MVRDYHGFTFWFEGDIRKMPNPLATETVFGKPVIAGIGNAFEERDTFEAALQEITRRWGHISDLEEFCLTVLDGEWRPPEEDLP